LTSTKEDLEQSKVLSNLRTVRFAISQFAPFFCFYVETEKSISDLESVVISKLNDKVEWIASHINEVGKFFKVSNVNEFTVEGVFVTNSLIYYNFFSRFPIIPLDKLLRYIEGSDRMCVIS